MVSDAWFGLRGSKFISFTLHCVGLSQAFAYPTVDGTTMLLFGLKNKAKKKSFVEPASFLL